MPVRLFALFIFVVLVGTGCGTDDNSRGQPKALPADCATGAISGAGSTFAQTIVQEWIKDYTATCKTASVNYQGVGSGAGIQQFGAGTTDFAATDVPLSASEQPAVEAKRGETVHIPWAAGGIAVEYNLSGEKDLKLTPRTLAGIFAGLITRWNDPALTADNPGTQLPNRAIQVVHRSDGSGTTAAFTSFLAATAPDIWTVGSGKDVRWPTGQGAKGSDGVTAAVEATNGSIGYAEVSFALANSLGVAKIANSGGTFTEPTSQAVSSALESAQVKPDGRVALDYRSLTGPAYPISTVTYAVLETRPRDPAKVQLLRSFANYATSNGQASASALAFAPLSGEVARVAKENAMKVGAP